RLRVGLAAPRNNDLPPPAAGILYRIRPFSSSAGAALAAWGSNMSYYIIRHLVEEARVQNEYLRELQVMIHMKML
ncbi:hypothetical protein, partial [Paenibacillus thermoaerophilus]|uniref:hypothetical protein n=1 Tax=Paenibacillus thermoaerophilus TaxID=1215385 RepID=UPI001B872F1A